MDSQVVRRPRARWGLALGVIAAASAAAGARAGIGTPPADPAAVVPLDRIAPEHRGGVADVIRDPTLHRRGAPETFPCNPRVYMKLLNEPAMTLGLWQDLGPTPARLQQVGPGKYQGSDGAGTNATGRTASALQDAFVYALNDGLRVGALVALAGAVLAFVLIEPKREAAPAESAPLPATPAPESIAA